MVSNYQFVKAAKYELEKKTKTNVFGFLNFC